MHLDDLRKGLLPDNQAATTQVSSLTDTLKALVNTIPGEEQTASSRAQWDLLITCLDILWAAITTANLTTAFGRVSADLFGQMFDDNLTAYDVIIATAISLQLTMNGTQAWMAARPFKKLQELYKNTKKALSTTTTDQCLTSCDNKTTRLTHELVMTVLSLGLSLLAATFLAGAVNYAPDGVHLPKSRSAFSPIVSYCDKAYRLDTIQKLATANMYIYLVTLGQNGCRQTLNAAWQSIPDIQQALSIWLRFYQLLCTKQAQSILSLKEKILAHHRKIHRRKQAHAKTPDNNKLRNAVIKSAIASTRNEAVSDLNTFTLTVIDEYKTEKPVTCCEKTSSLLIQVPCVLSNLPWMGVLIRSGPFGPVVTPVLATLALILNTKIALDFTDFLKQSFNTRSVSVAESILDKTVLTLSIAGTLLPAFPSVILGNDQRTTFCLTGKHFTLLRQDNRTTYEEDSCEIFPAVFKTTFAVLGMLGVMLYLSLAASSLANRIATPLKKISDRYENATQHLDTLVTYQASKIKSYLDKYNDATKLDQCKLLINYSEENLFILQQSLLDEYSTTLENHDHHFTSLHSKIRQLDNDTYQDERFTEEEILALMQYLANNNLSELTKHCLIHDIPNNEVMVHAFRCFYTINCLILSIPLAFSLYPIHQPTSKTQLLGVANLFECFVCALVPLIDATLSAHIKTKIHPEKNSQKICLWYCIKPSAAPITYFVIGLGTAIIMNNTLEVIGLEDLNLTTYAIIQCLIQNFNYSLTYSAVEGLEKRFTSLPVCDNQHPLWRAKCCPQVPNDEDKIDDTSRASTSLSERKSSHRSLDSAEYLPHP